LLAFIQSSKKWMVAIRRKTDPWDYKQGERSSFEGRAVH
jgi:hypothetical protein